MFTRILCIIGLLMTAGCASFRDGYTTRFGLANPDTPPINPNPVDEAYPGGTIGQQHMEEYDKKYHDRAIFRPTGTEIIEEETPQSE